jgi:hypothetical protein
MRCISHVFTHSNIILKLIKEILIYEMYILMCTLKPKYAFNVND